MLAMIKLLVTISFLCFATAFPSALPEARALHARHGSMCDTTVDNLTAILPADLNTRGGRPILPPISPYPTFVTLSVGVQNYTCLPNGTYAYVNTSLAIRMVYTDALSPVHSAPLPRCSTSRVSRPARTPLLPPSSLPSGPPHPRT